MIVEDHDMSDCLATCGYKSRLDREDFPLPSRCCIRQPVDSKIHHSFLTPSKINISENFENLQTADNLARRSRNRSFKPRMTTRMGESVAEINRQYSNSVWGQLDLVWSRSDPTIQERRSSAAFQDVLANNVLLVSGEVFQVTSFPNRFWKRASKSENPRKHARFCTIAVRFTG